MSSCGNEEKRRVKKEVEQTKENERLEQTKRNEKTDLCNR
jgi:hypothetical protein